MSGRRRWRHRHPVAAWILVEIAGSALCGAGEAMVGTASGHTPATQPELGIGATVAAAGYLLISVWLIVGLVRLGRFLFRSGRGDRKDRARERRASEAAVAAAFSGPAQTVETASPPAGAGRVPAGRVRADRVRADRVPAGRVRADRVRAGDEAASAGEQPRTAAPASPRVRVLMLGDSGSGKTTLLATLYHRFALGGQTGIRFAADDDANGSLRRLVTTIRDPGQQVIMPGTRPPDTRTWEFDVLVESSDQEATAFTLEYLDYPGGYVEHRLGSADTGSVRDPQFEEALVTADVLMGILDGEKVSKLMNGAADLGTVLSIENLLNILVRAGQRNVHLLVTKWDLMRGAGGERYTITDVRDRLAAESTWFRDVQRSRRLENMRIIPVSALGLNGFVRADPGVPGVMAKVADRRWEPWNVQVPFYCAVPDILQHDVAKLAGRQQGNIARITRAVLDMVGIATVQLSMVGLITVNIPVNEVLTRIWQYVHDTNQRGKVPEVLSDNAAISFVLNECYAQVAEFEKRFPDSRLQRPAADG
jgi:hypothetical protein